MAQERIRDISKYYYRPTPTVSDLSFNSSWLILVGLVGNQRGSKVYNLFTKPRVTTSLR